MKPNELIAVLLKINSSEEMEEFLKGLFTPQELETLATRLQIVKMIKKGIPHQQIAEKLKVGVATVTRGSRELKMNRFRNI